MSSNTININFATSSKQEIINRCQEWINDPQKWIRDIASFMLEWFNDSESVSLKTSGTTGDPKEIEVQKIRLSNSALMTGSFFNLRESTTALLCLSPTYIAGKMMLVRSAVLKWNLHAVEPSG
ncbi:MAG: O-succinylbenzoic acid--CoA ligase, partial [Bacteroidetes bacterium]|nr:O-succinylbenzoic acid--CoA ligase [Bacteroidota bacterium]